jgi:hypothetical protein
MRPALLKPLASAAPALPPAQGGGDELKCYAVFFTKDPFHKKVRVGTPIVWEPAGAVGCSRHPHVAPPPC